jgi:hypothetical protein
MAPGMVRALGWLVIADGLSHAVLPMRGWLAPTLSIDDWTPVGLYGVGMVGLLAAGSGLLGLRPLDRAISPLLVLASGLSLVAIARLADPILWFGAACDVVLLLVGLWRARGGWPATSSGGSMRVQSLAPVVLALLLTAVSPAAAAAPACCDACEMKAKAVCDMPCCNHHKHQEPAKLAGLEFLLQGLDTTPPQFDLAPPPRQTAVVWFHRPVWVGHTVLLGKYVIEHDDNRQARGEPCTHIYAAADPRTPVVTFHCTHLKGERAERDTVVLATMADGARKLLKFQFAGESAAHGYPSGR